MREYYIPLIFGILLGVFILLEMAMYKVTKPLTPEQWCKELQAANALCKAIQPSLICNDELDYAKTHSSDCVNK